MGECTVAMLSLPIGDISSGLALYQSNDKPWDVQTRMVLSGQMYSISLLFNISK